MVEDSESTKEIGYHQQPEEEETTQTAKTGDVIS